MALSEQALGDLFDQVVKNGRLLRWYGRDVLVCREVEGLEGRPDFLVTLNAPRDSLNGCLSTIGKAIAKPSSAEIMAHLKRSSPRTGEYLMSQTGLTSRAFRTAIRMLGESGAIEEPRPGRYVYSYDFLRAQREIHLFELKLRNWRRALYQAIQYRPGAHSVSVVMDIRGIGPAESNLAAFQRFRVGLLSLDPKNARLRWISRPAKSAPLSRRYYIYMLGKLLQRAETR